MVNFSRAPKRLTIDVSGTTKTQIGAIIDLSINEKFITIVISGKNCSESEII